VKRRNNIYPYALAFRVSAFCDDKRTGGGVGAIVANSIGRIFGR
jgi:hypothetical protein